MKLPYSEVYELNAKLEYVLGFKPTFIFTETERIAQKFKNEQEAGEAKKALDEKREKKKRKIERKLSGKNSEFDVNDLADAIKMFNYYSKVNVNRENQNFRQNISSRLGDS